MPSLDDPHGQMPSLDDPHGQMPNLTAQDAAPLYFAKQSKTPKAQVLLGFCAVCAVSLGEIQHTAHNGAGVVIQQTYSNNTAYSASFFDLTILAA